MLNCNLIQLSTELQTTIIFTIRLQIIVMRQ